MSAPLHSRVHVLLCLCGRETYMLFATSCYKSSRPTDAASTSRGGRKKITSVGKVWLYSIPVFTFCLGTWQVYRLRWKRNLIAQLERRTTMPFIEMPADIQDRLDELEYRRVRLHGYFNHSKELYVWPRTPISEDRVPGAGGLMGRRGPPPGSFVITPFFCHETNCFILVNRGWVPKNKMSPDSRREGQVEGEVTLMAVVRKTERRMPFAPPNDPSKNHWNNRDVQTMAQIAETEPIFVDADATTTVPGGPLGGQTRVYLRNEHLQYIITWYGLSLFTFYLARQLIRGKNMFR